MRDCIIAREGWIFIVMWGLPASILLLAGYKLAGLVFLLLAFLTACFFRNPERVPPDGVDLVISPADGKIVEIADLEANHYISGPAKKVSIFMSLFNVHVNRVPVAGLVKDVRYYPGRFISAIRDKASLQNERNAIILEAGGNALVAVVQIAGIIARRVVCYLHPGHSVGRGERLGLIRFGSRVELYLPSGSEVIVRKGDRVKAGLSIIGRMK